MNTKYSEDKNLLWIVFDSIRLHFLNSFKKSYISIFSSHSLQFLSIFSQNHEKCGLPTQL